MGWDRGWAPYVSVAKRRAQALREVEKLDKANKTKGAVRSPIHIAGRKMATTFWGEAWCDNLECYSDFSNRLPRGRTYARNGSILDLQIEMGKITALVSGSSLYKIKIEIKTLSSKLWREVKKDCSSSIHSMMDLLRGKLGPEVLQRLTQPKTGLFPQPNEIDLRCSCPDSAYLCKHLAAVMYGIGNRLDHAPEMLFVLRGVEQSELISEVVGSQQLSESLASDPNSSLAGQDLGSLFGIDLVSNATALPSTSAKTSGKRRTRFSRAGEAPAEPKPSSARALPSHKKTRQVDSNLPLTSRKKSQKPTKASSKKATKKKATKKKATKKKTAKKKAAKRPGKKT